MASERMLITYEIHRGFQVCCRAVVLRSSDINSIHDMREINCNMLVVAFLCQRNQTSVVPVSTQSIVSHLSLNVSCHPSPVISSAGCKCQPVIGKSGFSFWQQSSLSYSASKSPAVFRSAASAREGWMTRPVSYKDVPTSTA